MRSLLTTKRLSDCRGRDNNFNLMRMLAATLVVMEHAFGITSHVASEPVKRLFGIGAGDLGVDIFFVLSGFLVSKSLNGKTLAEFSWARFIRIYPGLWASTFITVAIAGLCLANQRSSQFFTSRDTLLYFAHNLTMLPGFGAQQILPHVFSRPEVTFNTPLWTLPHELQMYMLLALVGFGVGLRARYVALIALLGITSAVLSATTHVHLLAVDRGRFLWFFFAGSLAYVLRERIVLSTKIALPLAGVVLLICIFSDSVLIRQIAIGLALPYLLLWCAYVPGGFLRQWNRVGDYSYGVYIYAFPIQAVLATRGIATGVTSNFALSMAIVLPIAIASWHLLESRTLRIPLPQWRQSRAVAMESP